MNNMLHRCRIVGVFAVLSIATAAYAEDNTLSFVQPTTYKAHITWASLTFNYASAAPNLEIACMLYVDPIAASDGKGIQIHVTDAKIAAGKADAPLAEAQLKQLTDYFNNMAFIASVNEDVELPGQKRLDEYQESILRCIRPALPKKAVHVGDVFDLSAPASAPAGTLTEMSTSSMFQKGSFESQITCAQVLGKMPPGISKDSKVNKFVYAAGNSSDIQDLIAYYDIDGHRILRSTYHHWTHVQMDTALIEISKTYSIEFVNVGGRP